MNDIQQKQNAPAQIRLLQAQRHLYRIAKRVLGCQIVLTVAVPIIGVLASLSWPNLRGGVAFASLLIAIFDVALIDRLQRALRKKAATIQEEFDCQVLGLPWNTLVAGHRSDPEEIHESASRYLGGTDDATMKNWYPVEVGGVPIHLARIVCQRANLRWDSRIRRRYGWWLLGLALTLSVLLISNGLLLNWTIEELVVGALAPLSPAILWGLREFYRQRDAADNLDRVKAESERLWAEALSGQCLADACRSRSRDLQNTLFAHRSSSPLIFEWIYLWLRGDLETQMKQGAQELIRQATEVSK